MVNASSIVDSTQHDDLFSFGDFLHQILLSEVPLYDLHSMSPKQFLGSCVIGSICVVVLGCLFACIYLALEKIICLIYYRVKYLCTLSKQKSLLLIGLLCLLTIFSWLTSTERIDHRIGFGICVFLGFAATAYLLTVTSDMQKMEFTFTWEYLRHAASAFMSFFGMLVFFALIAGRLQWDALQCYHYIGFLTSGVGGIAASLYLIHFRYYGQKDTKSAKPLLLSWFIVALPVILCILSWFPDTGITGLNDMSEPFGGVLFPALALLLFAHLLFLCFLYCQYLREFGKRQNRGLRLWSPLRLLMGACYFALVALYIFHAVGHVVHALSLGQMLMLCLLLAPIKKAWLPLLVGILTELCTYSDFWAWVLPFCVADKTSLPLGQISSNSELVQRGLESHMMQGRLGPSRCA